MQNLKAASVTTLLGYSGSTYFQTREDICSPSSRRRLPIHDL